MSKKLPLVHCRLCKEPIDRNEEKEGIDWIMASRNWFYHKKCYESWKQSQPKEDDEWIDLIYDFISRDLKVPYDYFKCETQRKKFLKEDMTNKGIFFALKYFYEVKHGDWNKGYEGIGIVPYIYVDSCRYWTKKEKEGAGILKKIEEQMKEARARGRKVIHKKNKGKDKTLKIDFSTINEMESENEH